MTHPSGTAAASAGSHTIIETFPLGFQWATIDPFLFCVHHLDLYPAGNGRFGPQGDLAGRDMGQDFAGIDGWRMYHGRDVPGFPQHPHRGFETVTFVRRGFVDHSDSLGAAARYGEGDVQWLTAGSGIVHSEMFPLLNDDTANPTELFQIWLNLPRADKMSPPHFSMLWNEEIPRIEHTNERGVTSLITVLAGQLEGHVPPPPPPHSWASRADADVAIWHVRLGAGGSLTLPPAATPASRRVIYAFDGGAVGVDGETLLSSEGALVRCDAPVMVSSVDGSELLVLQGRPIGEPVAQHGPFVMNDRAGVEQAFRDYQATRFGGWPWATDDPVHGAQRRRFVRTNDEELTRPA